VLASGNQEVVDSAVGCLKVHVSCTALCLKLNAMLQYLYSSLFSHLWWLLQLFG